MKRIIRTLCAAAMVVTLAACGGGGDGGEPAPQQAPSSESESTAPANSLEEIIQRAQADFVETSQKLLDEQEKVFSEVGDGYEDYLANIDMIQAWYELSISETEALGERAVEYGREYYKAVVDNVDVTDDRELDKATEEFYDTVYEDAYDDYYDAIYEDAYDEMYDTYYDGIIHDAYDKTPYDEWSDTSSDAYEAYSDARSDVYEAISDGRSDVYSDYSDVRSAFYSNDFDVEGIFAPVQTNEGGKESDAAEPVADSSEDGAVDASAVDPTFKETMDGYEAFFGEYVEFMRAYEADPTSVELIGQYSDLMTRYTETINALGEIDEDSLTPADAAYYAEVTARIYEMLAEAGQ